MRRLSRSDIQLQALYTYITMRRLSRSDIKYRPYLHRTMRRLSRSDIQYRLYLYMLPREDLVDQIYNYRPYLHILPCEDSFHQIYNTNPIYIFYHEKTQSIRHTKPTISTYVTKRRLSESDIQYRPYLHMLPWEDSVSQIYNTDPIYICYQEKTQSIRYTIPILSTYVTMRRLNQSDIQYRPYLHILPMRRLSQSDIQYWRYLPMFEWQDSVRQIYNTDPIYICYHDNTQSIRYTIPTLST